MTDLAERLRAALTGRYTIQRELGRGGMATVYLAQDVRLDRAVALKVLHPELAHSLGTERFLNEVRVTANLQHPHILPLYDSGEADTLLFYVMPFVDGESLRQLLEREKQLGIEEAVDIARAVAAALGHAHARGVVHRDIKPENILLTGGQAIVADFGIALAIHAAGGERLTGTGLSLGTPHYMSPEQAAGQRDLTGRSDIYSLGAVLYEMLAGRPPHDGPTPQAIVAGIVTDEPVPVTALRRSVPAHVAGAIHKALAKTPADRFPTAPAFAEALAGPMGVSQALVHEPAGALTRWRRRAIAGWTVAALLVLMGAWNWLRPRALPQLPVVRSVLVTTHDRPERRWEERFAISPDGSRIVYRDSGQAGDQLFLRSLDELQGRPLTGTVGATDPFFSPDAEWIGFKQGSALRKISVSGASLLDIASPVDRVVGVSWSRDGTVIFGDGGDRIVRINDDGSGTREVLAETSAVAWPDLLPGGDAALVQIGVQAMRSSGNLAVISFSTGVVKSLRLVGARPRYVRPGFIVYIDAQGSLSAVPFDVRRLEVTGPPIPLADNLARHTRFAVSARALVFERGAARDRATVAIMTRGGDASPVHPGWQGNLHGLALSPDETRLAVTAGAPGSPQIWIAELTDGPRSRLTADGVHNLRPAWTPDGRSLTFVSIHAGSITARLVQQPADGSQGPELVMEATEPGVGIWEAVWSRDAQWLVFRTDGAGVVEDLSAVRPGADTVPRILFATPTDQEWNVTFSPDSRWFAYTSDESGSREVYVRPFPDVGAGKWQISTDGGNEAIWSHDGKEIFYRSGSQHLVSASVTTTPTFRVMGRQVLFDVRDFRDGGLGRAYDVSHDGRRFFMIRESGAEGPAEVVLVQNFIQELVARSRSGSSRE